MKITTEQIDKMIDNFMKAIKEKNAFIEHFENGGKVDDFKPKEDRKIVTPVRYEN